MKDVSSFQPQLSGSEKCQLWHLSTSANSNSGTLFHQHDEGLDGGGLMVLSTKFRSHILKQAIKSIRHENA